MHSALRCVCERNVGGGREGNGEQGLRGREKEGWKRGREREVGG